MDLISEPSSPLAQHHYKLLNEDTAGKSLNNLGEACRRLSALQHASAFRSDFSTVLGKVR